MGNTDNAACSGSEPLRLDRQPSTISTADVRNWNAFCEAADQCLAASSRLKRQNKCVHGAFFAFIGIFVFGINVLPRALNVWWPLKYAGVIVLPVVLAFIAFNCR